MVSPMQARSRLRYHIESAHVAVRLDLFNMCQIHSLKCRRSLLALDVSIILLAGLIGSCGDDCSSACNSTIQVTVKYETDPPKNIIISTGMTTLRRTCQTARPLEPRSCEPIFIPAFPTSMQGRFELGIQVTSSNGTVIFDDKVGGQLVSAMGSACSPCQGAEVVVQTEQ